MEKRHYDLGTSLLCAQVDHTLYFKRRAGNLRHQKCAAYKEFISVFNLIRVRDLQH